VKIPIPDDWNGEYSCIEIQWPDSTLWRAILLGLIDQMAAGRLWDERTGSIRDVQEVGRAIWRANVDLKSCAGESLPPPTPEQIFVYSGADSEDDCEMGCSGCLRINNGVLEMFACGEWSPVPIVGDSDNVGDAPLELPGQPTPTYYACGKAQAATDIVFRVANACWEQFDVPEPWNWVGAVEKEVGLDLNNASVISAVLLCVQMEALDIQYADVVNERERAWMQCQLVTKFKDNASQATQDDFLSAKSLMMGHALPNLMASSFWGNIFNAVGQSKFCQAAALGATTEGDCSDCDDVLNPPPNTIPTDGGPWWSGLVTKTDGEGAIAITGLTNNMRKAALRWMVDAPGAQYTNLVANLQMVTPANITSLRVHVTGEYPVEDWRQTGNVWDYPHQPTLTGVTGVSQNLVSADNTKAVIDISFDSGKPTGYEGGSSSEFRMLPGDTRTAGKTTTFEIEIISWA